MLCRGYKLSGYDATYRKATFSVVETKIGVLEITDTQSGETFILDLEDLKEPEQPARTRRWKKRGTETKGDGVSITYGSKGWYQRLQYAGKKRKMRTKEKEAANDK